jgi:hypothetical protein
VEPVRQGGGFAGRPASPTDEADPADPELASFPHPIEELADLDLLARRVQGMTTARVVPVQEQITVLRRASSLPTGRASGPGGLGR